MLALLIDIDRKETVKTLVLKHWSSLESNLLQAIVKSDICLDRSRAISVHKNAVERGIVATNSRGRLIVAEPKALLFCGALNLSLVNTRHASRCLESGPYKKWTELGTVEDDSTLYRAAFVARSVGTNQPHLVWSIIMSMNSSYEVLSVFSGPFIVTGGAVDDGMITKENMFYERAYLVSLTSNGILICQGEEVEVAESII